MENDKKLNIKFYQNLGKLFYAVAAIDKNVRKEEFDRLKEIVKEQWLDIDAIEDDFFSDAAYQIEIVFDWLYDKKEIDVSTYFNEFVSYRNEQSHFFTEPIKQLILKTADAIASSFAGKNKSELILLARLKIALN